MRHINRVVEHLIKYVEDIVSGTIVEPSDEELIRLMCSSGIGVLSYVQVAKMQELCLEDD